MNLLLQKKRIFQRASVQGALEKSDTSISNIVSKGDNSDEERYDTVSTLLELVEAQKDVTDIESFDDIGSLLLIPLRKPLSVLWEESLKS
ncbi:hypothetical protein JTB14_022274 [Gonioctena quinquepunctata]|nr:hypothetical protein JTB14_022274 [Gonioctena quinquepunctata]